MVGRMFNEKTIVLCGTQMKPFRRKKVLRVFHYLGVDFVVTYNVDNSKRSENKLYSVSEVVTGLNIVSDIVSVDDCFEALKSKLRTGRITTKRQLADQIKRSKNWSYLTNPYLVANG